MIGAGGNRDHFAANLRLLCGAAGSVSRACRELDINRQQFARYLSGRYLPSAYNVHRICDFFGLDQAQIFLAPETFKRLVAERATSRSSRAMSLVDRTRLPLAEGVAGAARYVGYWFRYLRSVEYPDAIIKAVVKVSLQEGMVHVKGIERLRSGRAAHGRGETFKYAGTLLVLADRLFIVEWDVLLRNAITETILYASHKHPMSLLFGSAFGISSGASRDPYLSPIVYEYAGARPDLRAMMRQCGLQDPSSPQIDERVRRFVTSHASNGSSL